MRETEYENRISSFLSERPILGTIARRCTEKSLRVYLTGGELRNLLLGHSSAHDVDLVFEGDAAAYELVRKETEEELEKNAKMRIDFVHVESPVDYVLRFDYTVNALLLDLQSKELIDPTGRATEDIRHARLDAVSNCLLFSNPHGILRGFRFAAQYKLKFAAEFRENLAKYRSVVCLDNEIGRGKTFGELLRFLSLDDIDTPFRSLIELGILELLIPEVAICVHDGKHREAMFERLAKLENVLSLLPENQKNDLTTLKSITLKREDAQRAPNYVFRFSTRALLRFSAICFDVSALYLDLDTPDRKHSTRSLLRSELEGNFLVNMASRFRAHLALAHAIKEIKEILPRARGLAQSAKDGQTELPNEFAKGSFGYLAAILALSELKRIRTPEPQLIQLVKRLEGV